MGKLRLSQKERRRLKVFTKVKKGEINLSKASELLSVSYRQVLRTGLGSRRAAVPDCSMAFVIERRIGSWNRDAESECWNCIERSTEISVPRWPWSICGEMTVRISARSSGHSTSSMA